MPFLDQKYSAYMLCSNYQLSQRYFQSNRAFALIGAPPYSAVLRNMFRLSVNIDTALVDTVPWRVVEIKLSI